MVFEDPKAVADRIRAEYRDMPGLSLTCEQAARLLNVDCLLAAAALDELQCEAFLVRASSNGRFVRRATTLRRDASNAVPRLIVVG